MGVKDLQKLNITGDQRDQIAPSLTLQLCRSQTPQGGKYLVPDDRQQFECDVVSAGLFSITKQCPGHGAHSHNCATGSKGEAPGGKFHGSEQQIHRQNRDGNGTEKAKCTKRNAEYHDMGQRPQQAQQTPHDFYAVSSHSSPSFPPGCSSSCCARNRAA